MSRRAAGLIVLGLFGLIMQVGLVILDTLSYQLSQQRDFTDLYLERYPVLQQLLSPLLAQGATILPQIAGPRAPAALGVWFGPLTVAWTVGCVVTALGYLGALWLLSRGTIAGRRTVWIILAFEVVFIVTVFVAPGLLSQDMFGYLMYGQIAVVHGLNPYIWPPSAFAHDPLLQWVAPIWRSLPSPYGPVWTDVNWGVARIVRDSSIVEQVLVYKALAVGLLIATLAMIWALLGRLGANGRPHPGRLAAFTAFAWNPLVLIETAGNGHNDALVLALLLAGLVCLVPRRSATSDTALRLSLFGAVALFVLSGLVKFLSGVASLFLLVAWLGRYRSRTQRIQVLVAIGACGLAVTAVLFAPWLELPDSLDPILRQTGGNLYANAVPDLVSLTIADQILLPAGLPLALARDTARLAMKALVDLAFVLYLLWETRRVWLSAKHPQPQPVTGVIRASARAVLVIIMSVSIWVQPWYFILPLGVAALLGIEQPLTQIAIGYTLTGLTVLYVHYYLQDAVSGSIYIVYATLPLLAPAGVSVWSRCTRALRSRRDWTRRAVRLVDERGNALVANTARSPAMAEFDPRPTNDRSLS